MNPQFLSPIDAFAGLRVAVVGEAMLDSYLEGTVGRLCQEAPVPVVNLAGRRDVPGGAANTAVNVCSLGGAVHFLSAVGDDTEGTTLRAALEARGVTADGLLAVPGRRTLTKHRVFASAQMMLRFDQGSTGAVDAATEAVLIRRLAHLYPRCDAVVVSDYGYGVFTPRVIRALAGLQARGARVVVADSRRLGAFRAVGPTAVKPNYAEAVELLGGSVPGGVGGRADGIALYGDQLLDATGARVAAVTLDSEGAVFVERGRPAYRTFAPPARRSCVAGAGDTFVGALALALAAGAATPVAAELASAAAAVVVGKEGTATCSAQELREYASAGGKVFADLDRLAARVEYYRRQGRRVVFTNGCFDILHRGHITYLDRAKAFGDVLVVGVNTDDGIRRLKGPTRPINTLEDRLQVLAALQSVDHLIAFAEDTPCDLVRALRPDVFVKGGDYTRERLPEAPLVEAQGGVVRILPFLPDRSTTRLIERIQAGEGRPAEAR